MSSSDPNSSANPTRWGRVFMGPDTSRESTIDKILNAQERELWNRSTEIEYLKRVREKAASEAQGLMEKAQARNAATRSAVLSWAEDVKARAEQFYAQAQHEREIARQLHAEAEALRNKAHEDGFQAGLQSAEAVIAQHEFVRDSATAAILSRVQEQCSVIFEAWRQELAALARETVETATGWILREEHAAIIEHILVQSAGAMEQRQSLKARVNPEDAEMIHAMLGRVQAQLGIERWEVQADPAVEPGGLVLESNAGRVDALPSTRRAIVEEVLARMGVPHSAVDDAAIAAVGAPSPELDALVSAPPSPESAQLPPMPEMPPMAEAVVPDFSDEPVIPVDMELFEAPPESGPLPGDSGMAAFSAGIADEDDAQAPGGDAEQRAMEMAAAAMDKALAGHDSLPDDVAAYIMDAVAEPGGGTTADISAEVDLGPDIDLDMDVSAPGAEFVAELPQGMEDVLAGVPESLDAEAFVDAEHILEPGEPLDLGGAPLDLGGSPLELGGEPLELGGEAPSAGGSLDLGGGPLELGGTPVDFGLQELDLGDD